MLCRFSDKRELYSSKNPLSRSERLLLGSSTPEAIKDRYDKSQMVEHLNLEIENTNSNTELVLHHLRQYLCTILLHIYFGVLLDSEKKLFVMEQQQSERDLCWTSESICEFISWNCEVKPLFCGRITMARTIISIRSRWLPGEQLLCFVVIESNCLIGADKYLIRAYTYV